MLDALQDLRREVSTVPGHDDVISIIVRRVLQATPADACSIHLISRDSGSCVLSASETLEPSDARTHSHEPCDALVQLVCERREAVHVEDTSVHPRCQATNGRGKSSLRAFLGAPIVHERVVLGVLVLQRSEPDAFDEGTLSFLITAAAQLAGPISDSLRESIVNRVSEDGARASSFLQGLPGAPGTAMGTVATVASSARLEAILPYRKSEDPAAEEQLFKTAVTRVQHELQTGGARMAEVLTNDERALFDAYVMLSGSESIVNDTIGRIREGNWAPGALRETIAAHARVFEDMEDPYLRARSNDIWDIGAHILSRLQPDAGERQNYPEHTVLVGEHVTVTQVADVPADHLRGVICTKGSGVSHTAILARALGIPAVMGLRRLPATLSEGRDVIVDGHQGRVYVEPSAAVRQEYTRLGEQERALSASAEALRHLPAETRDGARVALHVNSGLLSDVPAALSSGAEGVGLYRTEFGFMIRPSFPSEDEQYRSYRKILLLFAPKPVTMRTLDVGGDKALPYFSVPEDNPALGWRGIRVTLDHPEIFITQLRAMLRANSGLNNLSLVLPMVTRVAEIDESVNLLNRAHDELTEEGLASARPRLGVMVETPAAACQISLLAKRVEFFSIGTNDLTQHLLVADRNNPHVAALYDSLHPAVIRTIHSVVEEAHRWARPVSICGEMAGDPAAIVLFIAMGVDTLSASAGDLPRAKQVIRSLSKNDAQALLRETLAMEDPAAVRNRLKGALEEAAPASVRALS